MGFNYNFFPQLEFVLTYLLSSEISLWRKKKILYGSLQIAGVLQVFFRKGQHLSEQEGREEASQLKL